jgi:hypothetical protein
MDLDSRVSGQKIPTSQMQFQSIFQETNEVMYSDETPNHVCVIFIYEPFNIL